MTPAVEWMLFVLLAAGAITGAYRMLRTMSMARAGIFLMGSFCSVAGLLLLLSADLLAAMQIMMYVGGMLVMIVFMVMMSPDPGGSMMGIAPEEEMDMHHEKMAGPPEYTCPMHPEVRSDKPGKCPKCGMPLQPKKHAEIQKQEHGMDGMRMDMAMTHEFTRPAALIGIVVAAALMAAILSSQWPSPRTLRDVNSGMLIGQELLGRYMIAFEGAAILIIVGIVGAVILGRRE